MNKSEIAEEAQPLTYEQEVHAMLCAAAANTESLLQYFEAQVATETGDAKKLTQKCIDWKRDDLRRIRELIPKAERERAIAESREKPMNITAVEFYEHNATNVIKVPRPGHPEDQRGWDGVRRACEARFVAQDALVMTLPEAFEFAEKFHESSAPPREGHIPVPCRSEKTMDIAINYEFTQMLKALQSSGYFGEKSNSLDCLAAIQAEARKRLYFLGQSFGATYEAERLKGKTENVLTKGGSDDKSPA